MERECFHGLPDRLHIIEVVPLGGDLWFVTDNEAEGGRLMHGDFHSLARDWVASRGKGNQNIKVIGEFELGERSDTIMKLLKNVYDTDHSFRSEYAKFRAQTGISI